MSWVERIWRSNFLIRLRNWEYWPFLIVYWPVFVYWFWLSFRARSFFYFSASNPGIENGGMLGESKYKILSSIAESLKPYTVLVPNGTSEEGLKPFIGQFNYPIICKPDVGERGWRVEKIYSWNELLAYNKSSKFPYLIQEFLTEPLEMGIFYYRYPSKSIGVVSSLVIKEMLTLTGNGSDSVKKLILRNDRSKLQWDVLKNRYPDLLDKVLQPGESIELVAIGNHSRGTKFLNGNHLINAQLTKVIDNISKQINGFYFGRFDIKVASLEDLYAGKIKIMELNGAGSEPGHIYEPGTTLATAYRSIFHHWKVLFEISAENHKRGVPYLPFRKAWSEYSKVRAINK